MDVQIRGAHQLGDLSKRLKAAGEGGKGLRRELYRGINRATKPLKAEAKTAAGSRLPQRGGLAQVVARSKFQTKTRGGGRNVGVKIVAKGTAVRLTDRGQVRHPVFNTGAWVTQSIPRAEGWFTETMEAGAPKVRQEILDAMQDVARQITKG